ncbi:MAG: FecR domain-containing protein [Myxococcaceae bacterium]
MRAHHDMPLWGFATRELELGEHRFVEAHLEICPECTEQLAAIEVAREALELAREVRPVSQWAQVDERIGSLVEKRLQAKARGPWLKRLGFVGGGLVFAAAAAVLLTLWPVKSEPVQAPLALIEEPTVPTSSWARVDRAEGLSRVGGEQGTLADGTELHGGDVIRTTKNGKAFVHLPDRSHLRVGSASQLALTRSEADDVALTLERGTLAVRASHQVRKGFVVHTGGLSVQVIGTVFGVTNDSDVVEVSVSEGRVRVELPNGEQAFVDAGQRLRFDTRSLKTKSLKVAPAMEQQLAEVAATDDAVSGVEGKAMVAAVGGTPSAPPMLTAQGTPRSLPRLSASEARSRVVNAPVTEVAPVVAEPAPQPAPAPAPAPAKNETTLVVEAPPDVWPSLGGGEVIRGVPPRREADAPAPKVEKAQPVLPEPKPQSDESEWAPVPKKADTSAEWSAMPAPAPVPAPVVAAPVVTEAPAAAKPRGGAKDLETTFLLKADEAVVKGECERFVPGLEEIAGDARHTPNTELARVITARCFDAQMRPRQAMSAYRKYLEEYPRGRYADEAHQALGE